MAETCRDDYALQEPFEAFFRSSEESLESFLGSFTALSTVERALLWMNGAEDTSEDPLANINPERFSTAVEALDKASDAPVPLGHQRGSADPIEEMEAEEFDECASIRTGAMAVLSRGGAMDIAPSFDNFVDYESPIHSNGATPRAEVHADPLSLASVPSTNGGEDMEEDLVLPGTDLAEEPRHVLLTAADMAELREDVDEIQQFALDQNFDYDADIVGRTARLNPRERP